YGLSISGGALALLLSDQAASACFSPGLVISTTKAAVLIAAGQGSLAGVVSAKVIALTEGVTKAMLLTKIKIATLLLLGLGVLGVGVSLIPGSAQAQKRSEPVRGDLPKDKQSKDEALAELGKAQVEVAEAQVRVAEAQLDEARAAIQTAESDLKMHRMAAERMADLYKHQGVSAEEMSVARHAAEKSENDVLAKKAAFKTAEARLAVAKAQVRVVIAQTKVDRSQP
ncbi:MAG: hypothetical protein ACJ8FY_26665, partial [Gemmataceae bacterium]